jgi:hypothetical protein
VTDLALGKFLGMGYHDVRALPRAVYEVALEDLHAYTERIERERDAMMTA